MEIMNVYKMRNMCIRLSVIHLINMTSIPPVSIWRVNIRTTPKITQAKAEEEVVPEVVEDLEDQEVEEDNIKIQIE